MGPTLYDKVAAEYDRFYSAPRYQAEDKRLARILRREMLPGNVLDLGCGTGYLIDLLDHTHLVDRLVYTGLDLSAAMLKEARRKFPQHEFLLRDVARIPRRWSNSFDNVVSLFEPLNWTPDPDRVVRQVARILTPLGGKAILMCATASHSESDILQQFGIRARLRPYTAAQAHVVAAKAGLEGHIRPFSQSYELLIARRP